MTRKLVIAVISIIVAILLIKLIGIIVGLLFKLVIFAMIAGGIYLALHLTWKNK
jgi:hypothetical protein